MAQVTTADIRARIKDMLGANSTISAFTPSITIFDKAPMALQRGNLPAIIVTDGSGIYDNSSMGQRYIKITMTYNVTLYMQEWTAQTELNIDTTLVDSVNTAIEDSFTFYQNLNYNGSELKGVRDSRLASVTGIQPQPYPQVQNAPVYVSRTWQLQVIYTRYITNG